MNCPICNDRIVMHGNIWQEGNKFKTSGACQKCGVMKFTIVERNEKMNEEIILDDDPRAASQKTLTLWVSRNGKVYDDERAARYDGSTHHRCKCGGIAVKHYLVCDECLAKINRKKYKAMPYKEWDGETPLCLFGDDTYFWGEDDIFLYCEGNDYKIENLELVICEPVKLPLLEEAFFSDCLPEDSDLPDSLIDAINEFNEVVQKHKPLSWEPGKYRTSYEVKK